MIIMRRLFRQTAIILLACLFCACNGKKEATGSVSGTLEGRITSEPAPEKVHQAMTLAYIDRYEPVLNDSDAGVSVWSLVNCNPDVPSDGYGIHFIKDKVVTRFPDIYHGNNPHAFYNAATGDLWLFCGVMEGTGVEVEKAHLVRFDDNCIACIATSIDPYDVQEMIRERLTYRIKGEEITFLDGEEIVASTKNTVTNMGGFDSENPVWIGEQIRFDADDAGLCVIITPGIKFTTGLVLTYDDMPDLKAGIDPDGDGGFKLGKISACEAPNPDGQQ